MRKAMATYQACQVIGLPECRLNLAVSLFSPLPLSLSQVVKPPCIWLIGAALRRIPVRSTQVNKGIHSVQASESRLDPLLRHPDGDGTS